MSTPKPEPYDPLADPANTEVVAALRSAGPFTPPSLEEDKVVAMLRERSLWKPEFDSGKAYVGNDDDPGPGVGEGAGSMTGKITGKWQCHDCPAQIEYTATIVKTDVLPGEKLIRATVDNDVDLRDHAETHGHERGTKPLALLVRVEL